MSRWVAAAYKRSFAPGARFLVPSSWNLGFPHFFAVATSYSATRKAIYMNRPALNLAPQTLLIRPLLFSAEANHPLDAAANLVHSYRYTYGQIHLQGHSRSGKDANAYTGTSTRSATSSKRKTN